MPSEQEIGGLTYRIGKLNAKQQFHVARRLAPVIAELSAESNLVMEQMKQPNNSVSGFMAEAAQGDVSPAMVRLYTAISKAIRNLSDEDCDYVIRTCMSVVTRRSGELFQPVWNKQADQPQFEDLSLPTLLMLTITVITDNLGGFMNAQGEAGPAKPPTPPSIN
jgi:hypothetical protein